MSPLVLVAVEIAPELAYLLGAPDAVDLQEAAASAVQTATGSSIASEAQSALNASPATIAQLRLDLAGLVIKQRTAVRRQDLASMTEMIRLSTMSAVQQAVLGRVAGTPAWSVSLISFAVLASFGVVVAIVLLKGLPNGSETAANMLLGTLAAMATSVVSYWVGSSVGSARKDDRLIQAAAKAA